MSDVYLCVCVCACVPNIQSSAVGMLSLLVGAANDMDDERDLDSDCVVDGGDDGGE